MENSTIIIKGEIVYLLKEFKKLIRLSSNKVEDYLKDEYYFQDTEEMINDEGMNMFSKISFKYYNLAKEFRNFVLTLTYNVSHDHITELVLNDIVKRPIEYILHRRQSEYDGDSETDSDDDDESDDDNDNNAIVDNNLQSMINNISEAR